ncbi:hypothetical protein I2I11_20910 [Pontibacter sp. 172403-2]|uniref:hypothetical protein n=1 Tax=Pontibacter rufus TaxID=2791028 RepID=UPI0018B00E3F|nr:hypothetical protein [Pontibacter sp. 172403-2]MBF9255772.1 hypothetical protein [Pontibacter sp. 172403-2]
MMTTFQLILIAVALSSCYADVKTEIFSNGIGQTRVDKSDAQSAQFSQTMAESESTQQKSSSLIGKTTTEIENMGWFSCAGTLIASEQSESKYAVSQLAKSQNKCNNGEGKILLERFVRRNGDKAVFEVIDEINILSNYPEKEYNWTTCEVKGAEGEQFYVIHFKDRRQAELTEIHDLWTVDLIAGKFVKVKNAEGVTCVNPDYSDGL